MGGSSSKAGSKNGPKRGNLSPLELHVPEPRYRPGDPVDYSDLVVPPAGAQPRPDESCSPAETHPLCLDLIARGVIDVRPMIETVAPLADGATWFSRLSAKDGGRYMKVILTPG